jgi:hypothetical protein
MTRYLALRILPAPYICFIENHYMRRPKLVTRRKAVLLAGCRAIKPLLLASAVLVQAIGLGDRRIKCSKAYQSTCLLLATKAEIATVNKFKLTQ